MTDVTAPEHIAPHNIAMMQPDDLDKLVEALRQRRLASIVHYEAAQKLAQEATDEKNKALLQKQCDMCMNSLESAEKAIDRLETRVMKIRTLRMELGI